MRSHRITLLVPDSHEIIDQVGWATVRPWIGVFNAPCKSHFFIRSGQIDWMPAFSGGQAGSIMQAQIARHAAHDRKQLSLWGRIVAWIARPFSGPR